MRDLRVRLGVILALALLPLLIFTMWRSYADLNRDKALLRNNTDLTARIALTEIVDSFETTQSILRFTSAFLSEEGCQANLQRLTQEYPRFYNLILADDKVERIRCSAKPTRGAPEQGVDIISELSLENPFHTVILSFPGAKDQPEKVLVTAHAHFENGKIDGISFAVEDLDFLLNSLRNSKISEGSEVAIFNRRGEILGGDWARDDLRSIVQGLDTGALSTRMSLYDESGRPILILPTPAKDIFLAVATERENYEVWRKFNPLTYTALPVLAWFFGFAAIWLSTDQLILIHLRRMRAATLRFANGDRDVRVGKLNNPPASIFSLGKNFDQMADRIVERESTINDALDEKETLLREIHHRVKNNLQIIISLLNMQERKLTDKEGLAAIMETRSRINAIALVHRGLYESTDLRVVDMDKFLGRLLTELSLALALKNRNITVESSVMCEPMEADIATPVALFIVEALTNAVKHGVSGGGHITINLTQSGGNVKVKVSDTGGTASKKAMTGTGVGTKLMKGFARQLGGSLDKQLGDEGFEIMLSFAPRDIDSIAPLSG